MNTPPHVLFGRYTDTPAVVGELRSLLTGNGFTVEECDPRCAEYRLRTAESAGEAFDAVVLLEDEGAPKHLRRARPDAWTLLDRIWKVHEQYSAAPRVRVREVPVLLLLRRYDRLTEIVWLYSNGFERRRALRRGEGGQADLQEFSRLVSPDRRLLLAAITEGLENDLQERLSAETGAPRARPSVRFMQDLLSAAINTARQPGPLDLLLTYWAGQGLLKEALGCSLFGSALHEAASTGRPDFVRTLLKHGADPRLYRAEGQTPVYRVLFSWHLSKSMRGPMQYRDTDFPACFRLLLESGVHLTGRQKDGKTQLELAGEFGRSVPEIRELAEKLVRVHRRRSSP